MKPFLSAAATVLLSCIHVLAAPQKEDALESTLLSKKADSTKVGYLAVYWKTADPSVYFALSSNDDPLGFTELNGGSHIVSPTVGTGAVRDLSIVAGDGIWYIIATDLNIDETNWTAAKANGSRGIVVWQSTNLVDWTDERLVTADDATAGCVWAPDAVWLSEYNQFFVHWASPLYAEGDTAHTGNSTPLVIRAGMTSDFTTIDNPGTYIDYSPSDTLDLSFLKVNETAFVRIHAGGGISGIIAEVTDGGIWGTWNRPAGVIAAQYEGPYPFWDNAIDGKAWLLSDLVGGAAGLRAWESDDPTSGEFTSVDSALTSMRHGSVLAVTQGQYDLLSSTFGL
ncbi:hypothetical protein BJ166DRAFT_623072 [Pestalotiopsis sp. NC0098]|nr:hypothetical protein BJ166DRAFT_623072 [Pestalotiopsis sp. NC0098]